MAVIARLKRFEFWFQLHWLAGITAGTVLVVIGVTGGLMSFQQDILEWINASSVEALESSERRLSPPALVARYESAHPDHTVSSLFWRQDRPYPALIGYRTEHTTGRRGERAILNPFTAEPMPALRGQETFRFIRHLHQRLAGGDTGKFIVGVSTLVLVLLSVSGLWSRWQRRPRQRWRWVWPRALGGKLAGEWHAVLGVWALIAYLLASLTGLWWSFDWYRDGAKMLFASDSEPAETRLSQPATGVDLERAWANVAPELANAHSIFLRLPSDTQSPVTVRYVAADAPHVFANSDLDAHPSTGAILSVRRYDDLAAGDKLLASVYALHMGAFFGTPGIVFMMIASFAVPVFFVTGWILYIRRRRMKRQVAPAPYFVSNTPAGADALLVAYASQSGLAQRIATQTATALQSAGRAVHMAGLGELQPATLNEHRHALFVVSTHGEGDAPVAARGFDRRFCGPGQPKLEHLDYALLSLGDTAYADSYCAFGRRLDRALRERGARPLLAPIEVDKADTSALAEWRAALAGLFGIAVLGAEPAFDAWRLAERRILNPNSHGAPTAWLRLVPTRAATRGWRAGDIAEIRPRQPVSTIAAWLADRDIDGQSTIVRGDTALPLIEALGDRQLPEDDITNDPQAGYERLAPLAARDYSIANRDTGDALELLVRLARYDGFTGLASGWLIERAPLGATLDLRLRANPGFRASADSDAAPAIFIGNGTGIAGLRAHLQARIAAGQHANWLVFGERQRAADFYFAEEITAWHAAGQLAHLDLTFSRDEGDGRYVQAALTEQAERVRDWIEHGAHVFVCGSHDGMAPGVTAALVDALNEATVGVLNETGRIHMDVY